MMEITEARPPSMLTTSAPPLPLWSQAKVSRTGPLWSITVCCVGPLCVCVFANGPPTPRTPPDGGDGPVSGAMLTAVRPSSSSTSRKYDKWIYDEEQIVL